MIISAAALCGSLQTAVRAVGERITQLFYAVGLIYNMDTHTQVNVITSSECANKLKLFFLCWLTIYLNFTQWCKVVLKAEVLILFGFKDHLQRREKVSGTHSCLLNVLQFLSIEIFVT